MRVRRQSPFDFLVTLFETTSEREKRLNAYLLSVFGNIDSSKDGERQKLLNQINQLLNDNPDLIIYSNRAEAIAAGGGVYRFMGGFMVKL